MGQSKSQASGFGKADRPNQTAKPRLRSQPSGQDPKWGIAKEKEALRLLMENRLEEAEIAYRELISTGHVNPICLGNLAGIYATTNRWEPAAELLRQALQLKPDYADAHSNLGLALQSLGDLDAAIDSYNTALSLKPDYPEALNNLGTALHKQGDLIPALEALTSAISLRPNYPSAHYNRGIVLEEQGHVDAAIAAYDTALRLRPDYPDASANRAMALLLKGDYQRGWPAYDGRFRVARGRTALIARPQCPAWDGAALPAEQTVLLVSEQGLGDTLMFMRYLPALRQRGIQARLCAPIKLHSLIQASGIDPEPLSPEDAQQLQEARWMPLLSLPRHLGVSASQPLIQGPYISAPEPLIQHWHTRLGTEQRPIIAINWQGNPEHETTNSRGRSLALECFAPLAANPKLRLLSLQKGFGSEQLDRCSFRDRFVDAQAEVDATWDFLDNAAIIAACDLVITSDTSIAHLAAGLGKTTWLLLKQVPEWRWGLEGERTGWYPSMRLFRQRERGNWAEVMERVAAALEGLTGSASR